jgi:hypothetical protein
MSAKSNLTAPSVAHLIWRILSRGVESTMLLFSYDVLMWFLIAASTAAQLSAVEPSTAPTTLPAGESTTLKSATTTITARATLSPVNPVQPINPSAEQEQDAQVPDPPNTTNSQTSATAPVPDLPPPGQVETPISGQPHGNTVTSQKPITPTVDQSLKTDLLAAVGNDPERTPDSPPSIARPPSGGTGVGPSTSPSAGTTPEQQLTGMNNATVLIVCFCALVGCVAVVAYVSYSKFPRRKQPDTESDTSTIVYQRSFHSLPPPAYHPEPEMDDNNFNLPRAMCRDELSLFKDYGFSVVDSGSSLNGKSSWSSFSRRSSTNSRRIVLFGRSAMRRDSFRNSISTERRNSESQGWSAHARSVDRRTSLQDNTYRPFRLARSSVHDTTSLGPAKVDGRSLHSDSDGYCASIASDESFESLGRFV